MFLTIRMVWRAGGVGRQWMHLLFRAIDDEKKKKKNNIKYNRLLAQYFIIANIAVV